MPHREKPLLAASLSVLSILTALAYALRVVFGTEENFVVCMPDDAFYYLGIVRWHEALGVFSFDGGQTMTSGFHPLWAYLLMPIVRVAGEEDRLLLALVTATSALFSLGTAMAVLVAGWRRRSTGLLCALAVSVSSYAFLNGQISGMEWPLCIAASAALFGLLARERVASRGCLFSLFCLGLLGSLARTDFGGVPLACVVAALVYWRVKGRPRFVAPTAAALLGATVGLGLALLHNQQTTGEWLQASARVKAAWGAAAGWSPIPVLHQFSRSVFYVPSLQVADKAALKAELVGTAEIGAAVLLILGLPLWWWARSRIAATIRELRSAVGGGRQDDGGFFLLAALLVSALYLSLYSTNPVGIQSWYTAHVAVPALVFIAVCIEAFLRRASGAARALPVLLCAAVVVLNIGVFLVTPAEYGAQAAARTRGLAVAQRQADGTLEGKIGWADAGISGFYQGGTLINVDGLANDEIAAYFPDRLHCYLLDKEIRYVTSFGSSAELFLPLPDWSEFSTPMVIHGDDGTPVYFHEVDFVRLSALVPIAR